MGPKGKNPKIMWTSYMKAPLLRRNSRSSTSLSFSLFGPNWSNFRSLRGSRTKWPFGSNSRALPDHHRNTEGSVRLATGLGWLWFVQFHSLPGMMGNGQKWLSSFARWGNIPNQSQPNQVANLTLHSVNESEFRRYSPTVSSFDNFKTHWKGIENVLLKNLRSFQSAPIFLSEIIARVGKASLWRS